LSLLLAAKPTMLKVVVFAVLVVSAFGGLQPSNTVCPSNGGRLQLFPAAEPTSYPDFIPNVFVYTGNGQPLMSGVPQGPFIGNFQNCYFIPNSTLSCSFTVYNDSAQTRPIGTGSLLGTDFAIVQNGSTSYFGGDLTVTTSITNSPFPNPSDASTINFLSGTFLIHYTASDMYPPAGSNQAPLVNTIDYLSSDTGYITLWGSNGWTGTEFDPSTRTTGLDLRFQFLCPPVPPITTCSCDTVPEVYSVSTACTSRGTILRSSTSTCIELGFTASASTAAC